MALRTCSLSGIIQESLTSQPSQLSTENQELAFVLICCAMILRPNVITFIYIRIRYICYSHRYRRGTQSESTERRFQAVAHLSCFTQTHATQITTFYAEHSTHSADKESSRSASVALLVR